MCFRTKLEKKNTTKSLLVAGSSVFAHAIKEEDVVDEMEAVAPSSLSSVGRSAPSRTVTVIAPLRFIYNYDFKNLVEDYGLSIGEDLGWKMHLVIADAP